MRRLALLPVVVATLAVAAGCPATESFCKQQFDCQAELGLALEDDFVDVCVAQTDGRRAALKANAESACTDLANAEDALGACLLTLDCEKIADPDECKDFRDGVKDALDATDNGALCDAVEEADAGEGEGEGEGEG